MQNTTKQIVKELSPPNLIHAVKKFLHLIQSKTNQEYVGEQTSGKPSEWYDSSFVSHEHWRKHYTESHYYFLWSVIVDRITCAAIESILEIGC